MKYYIKAGEWTRILFFVRKIRVLHTRETKKLRRFLEAVWYVTRTGCQWRLLPQIYGHWRSVHARFRSWARRGIWAKFFELVQENPDTEALMIDATIVRAHACAAGYVKNGQEKEALGRSKGGFTTKIHALVDSLGNPLAFKLTGGQRHEITQASALLGEYRGTWVIADKGYDSNAFIQHIQERQGTPVIPPRKNGTKPRGYDKHWYRERHLIECFFGNIKHFRHVFSRFDKSAEAFLSFLQFTAILLWIK
jgi:transposase